MTANFDARARTWDTPQKAARAQVVAEGIKRNLTLTNTMTGFEYGCGTGLLSFCLSADLKHITLADSSVGMLEVLNEKIQAAGTDHMSPIQLDLIEDPAPETRFDLIYTMLTLHHINDTDRILRIFHTLLAEHGCLCIADLDKEDGSFHRAGFEGHNGFDRQALKAQLEGAGFSNIHFETCYTIDKEVDGAMKDFPVFLMICEKGLH